MKIGERLNVEIMQTTRDGKGMARSEEGKLILIDKINEDDDTVMIEITQVLEETIFAEKITRIERGRGRPKKEGDSNNPYGMDGDEDDDYE